MIFDHIKVTLLGDVGTGKTSIISRYTAQKFTDEPLVTVGTSNVLKHVTCGDKSYTFSIWDTAGQEKYKSISKMLYRDAKIVMIVFDVTQKSSLLSVQSWFQSVCEIADVGVIVVLLANKAELPEDQQVVSRVECEALALKLNCLLFFVSARTGSNIELAFSVALNRLLSVYTNEKPRAVSFKLSEKFLSESLKNPRKGGCCFKA